MLGGSAGSGKPEAWKKAMSGWRRATARVGSMKPKEVVYTTCAPCWTMLSSRSSTACWLSSGTLSLRIDRSTYGRSFLTCRNACSWAQLQPLSLVGLVYTCATLQLAGAAPVAVDEVAAGFAPPPAAAGAPGGGGAAG